MQVVRAALTCELAEAYSKLALNSVRHSAKLVLMIRPMPSERSERASIVDERSLSDGTSAVLVAPPPADIVAGARVLWVCLGLSGMIAKGASSRGSDEAEPRSATMLDGIADVIVSSFAGKSCPRHTHISYKYT